MACLMRGQMCSTSACAVRLTSGLASFPDSRKCLAGWVCKIAGLCSSAPTGVTLTALEAMRPISWALLVRLLCELGDLIHLRGGLRCGSALTRINMVCATGS